MNMSAPTARNSTAVSTSNMTKEDIPTTATAPSSMGAPPMKDDSNKEGFGLENSKAGSWSNQFLNKYPILAQWKSRRAFVTAQYQVFGILAVAYVINNWPISYPRDENHSDGMFWIMVLVMLGGAIYTMKHEPGTRGVQLLSRDQTEEWKGWMQFVFIMYHYYRNRSIYNEIRVLVSAYVWMTGFGNFLYFDKKQDFSLERMVSMWVRINYFPLMLSIFLGVKLELYYVVPLHTVGFFVTGATCYGAKLLREKFPDKLNHEKANMAAIGICLLIHILFFETSMKNILTWFSHEYEFRFRTDKYSAWFGMLSGFLYARAKAYMQWCYGEDDNGSEVASGDGEQGKKTQNPKKQQAMYIQRAIGVMLILGWYFIYGHESDKHKYNPIHPFVFWMPIAGWLMLRNSSKRLTEMNSTMLDFFGRITLETYVLQFHVFMCQNVQHIPVIIPGSGVNGFSLLKIINMLVTGAGFIALAYYARKATTTTQEAITELVTDLKKKYKLCGGSTEEEVPFTSIKPTFGIIEDEHDSTPNKESSEKDEEE